MNLVSRWPMIELEDYSNKNLCLIKDLITNLHQKNQQRNNNNLLLKPLLLLKLIQFILSRVYLVVESEKSNQPHHFCYFFSCKKSTLLSF
jgi:hypothetical protein